jgi:parallel beta-helix repeat protein
MRYLGYKYVAGVLLAAGLLLLPDAAAATYYISPSGRWGAAGTSGDPFSSIEDALKRKGGGHTYMFKPGVYTGQIILRPEHKGTPQNPTVLKSQEKYEAILHGSTVHNIYVDKGCDWIIIDGFVSSGAAFTGIKSNGDYSVVRNCWIVNNAQGIEAHAVKGSVIENNLVEYNGRHIQFDHGIYADGESLIIRNNIVRFNSSFGMHLYPSVSSSRIENNLVYGNPRSGIAVFGDGTIGSNVIVNNTVVRNGAGIRLDKSKGDVVYNNITVDNFTQWQWENERQTGRASDFYITNVIDPNSLKIDYNICSVKSTYCGPHTRVEDPRFIRRTKGLFYLNTGSPAIGSGSSAYYAKLDFFGNERNPKAIDLGCFSYYPVLLNKESRKEWFLEWPYHMRDEKATSRIPDLWKRPGEN